MKDSIVTRYTIITISIFFVHFCRSGCHVFTILLLICQLWKDFKLQGVYGSVLMKCFNLSIYHVKIKTKQAAADITGQLQVRPMLYTLYIGINLTIVKMLHTDNKQQIRK